MRLTDRSLTQLKFATDGQLKLRDDLLPGFGVIVGKRTKTFYVMYGRDRRTKTLGQYPAVSLKTARDEARRLLAAPSPRTRTKTLQEVISAFLEDCEGRLRPVTTERYRYSLRNVRGTTLENVEATTNAPNDLKALKVLFNWCIDHQYTDRNPFLRRKVIFNQRDRLLTDAEIKALWQHDYPPYSDIVKALILSGQRRNQIWRFEAAWKGEDTVTFPASIMKSKRIHVIPTGMYCDYLYPYTFNAWGKSKRRIDDSTGVTGWVLHDARRYFSSTMARLQVPLHVTECLLDHRSAISGVAAMYNRYQYLDEMREALRKYEHYLLTHVL